MSLYEQLKPALDKLFAESMSGLMEEGDFYDKVKEKVEGLDKEVDGLSILRSQSILSQSTINRILKVHNRVLLIRDLKNTVGNADNSIQVYMYPGLITYLTLTCFDQLGQPEKGWYFFPSWIKSRSTVEEVDNIVDAHKEKLKDNNTNVIKDVLHDIYNKYHQIYGVKKSFFKFLREVVSSKCRQDLHDSIIVEKFTVDHVKVEAFSVDSEYKDKWLFETRNNYTHNLFTTETNVSHGKYLDGANWYIREKILVGDGVIVIWVVEDFNSILEKCILDGIKNLIEN